MALKTLRRFIARTTPPPASSPGLEVHIFGDVTTLLRSNKKAMYNFEDVMKHSPEFASLKATFHDHCQVGNQLLGIANDIEAAYVSHGRHFGPEIVGLVIWSGSDFSWDPEHIVAKHTMDETFLIEKAARLGEDGIVLAVDDRCLRGR